MVDFAFAVYAITVGSIDFKRMDHGKKSYYLFVFIMNECCNIYSYFTYFYYGTFKFFSPKSKGGLQDGKEVQYEEQVQMRDALIPKIRESIRVSIRQSLRD